jgi:hypothetical protein
MVASKYSATIPMPAQISQMDTWLYAHFSPAYGDPETNNYLGYGTSTTELAALSSGSFGFSDSVAFSGWTTSQLQQELANGYPVIVYVFARMDAASGDGHYMVLLGMDSQNVYVNDPGLQFGGQRSATDTSPARAYPISLFNVAWAGHNNSGVSIHSAQVTAIFSDAIFISETGPNTIATFDDVSANTFAPFVSNGVSIVGIPAPPSPLPEVINSLVGQPDLFWFPGVGSPPNFLLTNIGPFQATFPVDARAVGFDYNCFACDGTASQDSVAWTLLSAFGDIVGSGVTTTDFTGNVKFFGLISDTPFRTVQISRSDPKNWELDNLRYSQ